MGVTYKIKDVLLTQLLRYSIEKSTLEWKKIEEKI